MSNTQSNKDYYNYDKYNTYNECSLVRPKSDIINIDKVIDLADSINGEIRVYDPHPHYMPFEPKLYIDIDKSRAKLKEIFSNREIGYVILTICSEKEKYQIEDVAKMLSISITEANILYAKANMLMQRYYAQQSRKIPSLEDMLGKTNLFVLVEE